MTAFNALTQRKTWKGRKREVGEQLHAVLDLFRELEAPKHLRPPGDRRLFGSTALNTVIEEAETAFDRQDYDKAEHLAKVATFMAHREIARFKADPKKWIERRQELDA
jgi:hypothetical protein